MLISGKCVTVVRLEDEDGMNRRSCRCSTWTGPAGSATGPTGPARRLMADCVPPLLLEACVLLGASEDKLADLHQVSALTDKESQRKAFKLWQKLPEIKASSAEPRRLRRAVVGSLSEHKEVFNACVSTKRLWLIDALQSRSEILFGLGSSRQMWKFNTDK